MLDRLDASRDARVVVVSAPAGSGKTTLLAQWAEHDRRPAVWLQIDEHQNDRVELIAYIVHALRGVAALDPRIDEWLSTESPPIENLILPVLANDLALADAFLFVLDDTHALVGEDSWCLLQFLVEHAPSCAQIVLGGRVEPRLSLGKLLASYQLVEVRSEDLAFRKTEAEGLLARAGLRLEDEVLKSLLSRTEGWAAGLQLATLYLQNRQDPGALAQFRGDVGHVRDYLAKEVMASLPSSLQRFILRTAVLEHLSAGLCNAVMGYHGSGEILAELQRSNLFITRLDEAGRWYRYHQLFAEWLRTQLERQSPDDIGELHRRAASWYQSRGMPEDAFDHWMAAGDAEHAGEVVVRHYRKWAMSGRGATVLRWFSAIGEEQILKDPQLALAGGWLAAALGHSQTAAVRLAAAERGDAEAPSLEGAATFGSALLMLRAMLGRRGVGSLRRDAEAAYELERSGGGVYEATAACLAGVGRLLDLHDNAGARALLEEGAALGREGRPGARAACLGLLALLAAQSDHWDEADGLATMAQRVIEEHKLSDLRYLACIYAVRALGKAREGEQESAQADLELVGRMLTRLAPFPWLAALVCIVMAWSALMLGDAIQARALQQKAARAVEKLPEAGLLNDWIDDLRTTVTARTWEGPTLTQAELRVLQELTSFRQLSDMASDLFVSTNTVKSHLKLIYRKLGVSSRAEAIERARSLGMVELD
jgi:LuxR family maltose regulon positive regulatory protein